MYPRRAVTLSSVEGLSRGLTTIKSPGPVRFLPSGRGGRGFCINVGLWEMYIIEKRKVMLGVFQHLTNKCRSVLIILKC
ncbi:hypothetical protein SAMN05428975_5541 [Mucilaginibacter sp. OK268]|jgi:hypothetical protein|nr:hypothetical protein SAMN05428975_5541 [Mucilaginibacter sp. OK268]